MKVYKTNECTDKPPDKPEPVFEKGPDGKLRLKKKHIDIKDLDDETLRRLGIDPSLSAVEIAKKLKVKLNIVLPTEKIFGITCS